MARVGTTSPEEATGQVAAVYGGFADGAGMIPGPVRLMSASPGLFEIYTGSFAYWRSHPTLSPDLLTCIRHGVAVARSTQACIDFNEQLLGRAGMSDDELAALRADPRTAPLEDKELELLAFVLRSVADPSKATQADVDALRGLGWTDADIVDATYHGTMLVHVGLLMSIFEG